MSSGNLKSFLQTRLGDREGSTQVTADNTPHSRFRGVYIVDITFSDDTERFHYELAERCIRESINSGHKPGEFGSVGQFLHWLIQAQQAGVVDYGTSVRSWGDLDALEGCT